MVTNASASFGVLFFSEQASSSEEASFSEESPLGAAGGASAEKEERTL